MTDEDRPGIVPLRPLDALEIVGGAVRLARRYPLVVLGPAFLVALVIGATQYGIQLSGAAVPEPGQGLTDVFVDSLVSAIPLSLLYAAVLPPMLGMVLSALRPAVLGRGTSLAQAWATTRPRLPSLYGLQIGLTLLGLVPILLLVGVAVPMAGAGGVAVVVAVLIMLVGYLALTWIGVLLYPATAVIVVEGLGLRDALWRSVELVRGSWWRFFGVQLLAVLLLMVAGMVVMLPLMFLGIGLAIAGAGPAPIVVGTLLASTVLMTLALAVGPGVIGLLHQDQRIRRERYDLDLAREAAQGW
ncbi:MULTISPECIES: hypothetical protein [Pseudonocardia]|uniref:DUF7847 domain-containing protein n=2 Tax=Pseudonocardia TaxID=1847 RepID=A0A1Y2MSC1_PSEAH|nr:MULTISPECIES: hypothetical protein [Pseudonocardia]OSY38113.1 hypothetical protein BG845_04286 [Pseudonocardia autotrophica]TDN75554.1 hypothetical protein C8E95_4731 [Pseudonocardia autotrophica]BBF99524.1 hypothetical protein Pdca_07340 [Pseudonocardia autotrophica]GEC29261.1 hypothetical protein PSA01_62900 [Pseudonocardia saturnea]